jgi:hypothetical protein
MEETGTEYGNLLGKFLRKRLFCTCWGLELAVKVEFEETDYGDANRIELSSYGMCERGDDPSGSFTRESAFQPIR